MRKSLLKISSIVCTMLFAVSIAGLNKKNVFTPVREVELIEQNVDFNTFYNSFENASFNVDGSVATFKGDKKISDFDLSFLDNMSEDAIIEKTNQYVSFDFKYNCETSIIIIDAAFTNGEEVIIDELIGYVFKDENGKTDALITLDDDSTVLLSDLETKYINNCGWLSRIIKSTVSVVAAAVVVAVLPFSVPLIVAAAVTYVGVEIIEYKQAKDNYKHNKKLPEPSSYIYGQDYYSDWRFGASTMDKNGCGIIATYNVLLGLNRRKNLADIAYSFDKNSGTLVSGLFGADPSHFGEYFKENNIKYKRYSSYGSLQEGINNMSDSQMILVCAWNGNLFFDGAHYVAASYNSKNAKPITVYNLYGDRVTAEDYSVFDKTIIGGKIITAYIVG